MYTFSLNLILFTAFKPSLIWLNLLNILYCFSSLKDSCLTFLVLHFEIPQWFAFFCSKQSKKQTKRKRKKRQLKRCKFSLINLFLRECMYVDKFLSSCVAIRRQPLASCSHLPSCWCWGHKSRHQPWQQSPYPLSPHWPSFTFSVIRYVVSLFLLPITQGNLRNCKS